MYVVNPLAFKLTRFGLRNPDIHSIWVYRDEHRKIIYIYTVIDELDFEVERNVFQNLYSDFPVEIDGYYLELRCSALQGRDVFEVIDAGRFERYYNRILAEDVE